MLVVLTIVTDVLVLSALVRISSMAVNMFAYWVLAFPLAFLAAITYKAPPNYIWGGFVVGLGTAAILLTWRYNRLSRCDAA